MRFRTLALGAFFVGMGIGVVIHKAWSMPEEQPSRQQLELPAEQADSVAMPEHLEANPERVNRVPGFSPIVYSDEVKAAPEEPPRAPEQSEDQR